MNNSTNPSIVPQESPVIKSFEKKTAVYMRVSTSQQTTRSQEPDLKRWVLAQILQQGRI
jgi:hypothetical protein